MNDFDLLRQYEPVLRYTHGEMFFPSAIEPYLERCSLWQVDERRKATLLEPVGAITPEKLGTYDKVPAKNTLYLQFVQEPLSPFDYQQWYLDDKRPRFKAPGRLARVSLLSRIGDALFDTSLLLRGTVPGGTTASADLRFREMRQADPHDVYYGRVTREGGYIILQYLFFYPMNDWRSTFYGVNDHEADWEKVFVFLSDEGENPPIPRWVAYAAHEFEGDDLRRRWDDPDLEKVNETHPVVYVGAGSHASYFKRGEYIAGIEPAILKPIKNIIRNLREFWVGTLKQGDPDALKDEVNALFRVPFVDYARGDGVHVGAGQAREWHPKLLSPDMAWVENYRGLWGLDTLDFVGGERAPAGPKFERDGQVRQRWFDPLGWVGLDKVMPPNQTIIHLKKKISQLKEAHLHAKLDLQKKRAEVRDLALEVQAFQATEYHTPLYHHRQATLDTAQAELQAMYRDHIESRETLQATRDYLRRIEKGDWGDPQAHIHHVEHPEPPVEPLNIVLEFWAAVSGGVLLLVLALSLIFELGHWWYWALGVTLALVVIEGIVRRRLANYLLNVTVLLAIVTTIVLLYEIWWVALVGALAWLVGLLIRDNVRELWST
jgi:hypothetical protein